MRTSASGLTNETVRYAGIYTERDPNALARLLNYERVPPFCNGGGMVFPHFDGDGNRNGYATVKPHQPRIRDDKPLKYEAPLGEPPHAYISPTSRAQLNAGVREAIIIEGIKKGAGGGAGRRLCGHRPGGRGLLEGQGQRHTARPGGHRLEGQGRLHHLRPRPQALDPPAQPRGGATADECTAKLGVAEVRYTTPPPGKDGAKNGLDDYLAAFPREQRAGVLRKLLDEARLEEGLVPNESADDPHRLAHLYIAERCEHPDGLTLRSWREQWHRWDGSAYHELPDAELQGELTASAKREMDRINMLALKRADRKGPPPTVQKITRGMVGNVEMALASLTGWPGTIEPPLWWDGKEWRRRNLIALANGLLDLDALFAGEDDVLLPHTPRWFSPACLPYPFDPEADCPRWRAFLERNLEGEAERIALLQEWFGYCTTADTSRQKFLLLEGEGANGKSVVCAVLEAMLGSENCSHVPLEVFGTRFQLEATLGKLANIASEVGELDKAAEGFLKSFTSGDPMQFERKHKPTFSAVPTARLVLATNNRPRFSDRSAGVWRRMILMPFRVTIAADDPGRVFGMDKPAWWVASGELPGILNWALAGLERLRRQDRFSTSQVCEQALAEYRTENNPARLYLTETCQEAPLGRVDSGELYAAYRRWCEVNNFTPLASTTFGKEVKRVFPKSRPGKSGPKGGQRPCYRGIYSPALDMVAAVGQRYGATPPVSEVSGVEGLSH